ncbi:transcription termination factor MTEF18, mitochondrial-like [Bidens hawaiensis]|uniref:transcription termination factor MTEF18, mitochondrial-like n=1 Tax=Bidens hawaiensis TaxID=980011 RepID=UPI00404B6590
MNNLLKLQTCSYIKWAFTNFTQNPRFYGRKPHIIIQSTDLTKENKNVIEAQDALIEYLHSTRNLQYSDAENISRNSPTFVKKLVKSVENKDVKQSLRRLFRYHPVNEFEPFFESVGMNFSEYSSLLPRDMMYLADDQRLLSNYHVLCEYGISPKKIGKICLEAREAFRFDDGILLSQLKSLQARGFTQSWVAKLVISSPNVLVNDGFLKVLQSLTNLGIVHSWFEENVLEEDSYNWNKILETLCLIKGFGFSKADLKELLCKNPNVLLEKSGDATVSLLVFLIKFGVSNDDILSGFKQLRQIKIQTLQSNIKNCCHFLVKIEMDDDDIANIIRTHWHVLGSCTLKTVKSLLNGLKTGKKRLRDILKENPFELKNWVVWKKVTPLPKTRNKFSPEKIRFLSNLGFVENSDKMTKALNAFRGSGAELQERFDCLVNAGLTRDDVAEMVQHAPHVINQTKEVLETKIDFLVNGLGYDVSSLVKYPAFLGSSIQKIKLRFAMFNWLMDRGKVNSNLALSTVLATSDKMFVRVYVERDPEGLIVWDNFKKQFFPDEKVI